MKQILRSLALAATMLFAFTAQAQLADGVFCPDFTGTDIDGNTWNLYDLLDEGKSVIIEVSATWCGPCWSYHTSEELKDFYNAYGPDGTNEAMVLFIEGDADTGMADLEGSTGSTQGNWIEGTPFPIIDDASISDILNIGYFPTVYTVCPNRILTQTGPISSADHYAFIQENGCQPASEANDPAVFYQQGTVLACGEVDMSVTLQNNGTETLTSATIEVTNAGNTLATVDWTGSLETYEFEEVDLGTVTPQGGSEVIIEITSNDDSGFNNSVTADVQGPIESTTHFYIEITTDNWGEETGWEIEDENGNIVASVAVGSYASLTGYTEDVFLPSTGCYTFRLIDSFGDGLYGSQYGGEDGECTVFSMDNGNVFSTVYEYDGDYNFDVDEGLADAQTVTNIEENEVLSAVKVFPNPTNGILNVNFETLSSSEVSIDVVNILGATVLRQDLGTVQTGVQRHVMDLNNLEAGIYLVNITANNTVSTVRVNLVK